MHRETLIACAPYVAAIFALLTCQGLLLRFSRARLQLAQLRQLHRDERGAVQSLSFVLTLPVFMFIMMFIVQLALITMARISVEYSAYAAARSAIVWFPANLGSEWSAENRVSISPLVPMRRYESNGRNYTVYRVAPDRRQICQDPFGGGDGLHADLSVHQYGVSERAIRATRHFPRFNALIRRLAPWFEYQHAYPRSLEKQAGLCFGQHACRNRSPSLRRPDLGRRSAALSRVESGTGASHAVFVAQRNWLARPGLRNGLSPIRVASRTRTSVSQACQQPDRSTTKCRTRFNTCNGVFSRTLVATTRMGNEGQKPTPTDTTFSRPNPTIVHPTAAVESLRSLHER